ncbi:hypothetical protein F2Q68_00031315 [Brassica cretica]|uniref:Uncharacterized protein n=1 Tax=Brassica cretica TaxID=69181 RepID=A0A8S9GA18_BRACR|nr:hypothetical protein F2Q68_00031315 [Brassica cretica]
MIQNPDITVELVGLNWSGFRQDQLPRTVSWLVFLTDTDSYWIGKPSKAVGREKGTAESSYRLDGARERLWTDERLSEGRSESQIWPRDCLFNATPSDSNVEQIILMILERDKEKYRERVILIERDRDREEETGRILIRLSTLRNRSQAKGKGNDRRSGDNVRKGSVFGSDQFLLDTGYWIGCVLDRVGLTGRQAVEELNGGFGASVGSSERTREREYVSGSDGYAVGPCCEWNVLLVLDGIEGCGADYVLTDPGVIRDWFWDAKHG